MAWVTPTNVATGDVLTAATWNQAVVENSRVLRGDFAQARRTSGNITMNSTAWANLDTGLDLTLAAGTDDIIEASLSGLAGSEAVDAFFDVVTIVGSTVTNSFATGGAVNATGNGVLAWRANISVLTSVGGSFFYKVVSGDVSGGNVVLRIRYRTNTATNKGLFADTTLPFVFQARNHGPVEI